MPALDLVDAGIAVLWALISIATALVPRHASLLLTHQF
jgi:hypothetical protein